MAKSAHGCMIAHARIDEQGNAHGGKAGDQNGRELCVTEFYVHPKCNSEGWRVFRPVNPNIAEDIATAAEAAVRNPNIGYDQHQRGTLFAALDKNGFDMASITTPCECDCSSLVHACLWAACIPVAEIFRTKVMPGALMETGAFFELTSDAYRHSGEYLLRGDILVTPYAGHTVIVVQSGEGEMIERNRPEWREVTAPGVWNIRKNIPTNNEINPDNILGTLRTGDKVRFYGVKDGWAGIVFGAHKGFVNIRAFTE